MRILVIIHADFERLGAIHTWLNKKGCDLMEVHPYRGEVLPKMADFDGLIIMGGPQDLKEIEKYDYLQKELSLIQNAIHTHKLVLGICLGAQLIAESLGAKTESSPEREIGIFPVQLTEAGYSDQITRHFPEQFKVGHWHNDMPGLPAGAKVLATSLGCPRQIICFRPYVYGLQCHFEFTIENIRALLEHQSEDLPSGRFVQNKQALLEYPYQAINKLMWLFLDNFVQVKNGV